MTRSKLPPVVIGPTLMGELGPDRGRIVNALTRAGIRVVMDPFGLDDTPLDVQRQRWQIAREAVATVLSATESATADGSD